MQLILEELRQSDPPDAEHVLQELDKLKMLSVANGKVCATQILCLFCSSHPVVKFINVYVHVVINASYTQRKDLKVDEAKHNFHNLVHSLLKNPAARQQFFKVMKKYIAKGLVTSSNLIFAPISIWVQSAECESDVYSIWLRMSNVFS